MIETLTGLSPSKTEDLLEPLSSADAAAAATRCPAAGVVLVDLADLAVLERIGQAVLAVLVPDRSIRLAEGGDTQAPVGALGPVGAERSRLGRQSRGSAAVAPPHPAPPVMGLGGPGGLGTDRSERRSDAVASSAVRRFPASQGAGLRVWWRRAGGVRTPTLLHRRLRLSSRAPARAWAACAARTGPGVLKVPELTCRRPRGRCLGAARPWHRRAAPDDLCPAASEPVHRPSPSR